MQKTQEMQVRSLGQEEPLEKGVATHSSILAWKIPWTEETGRLWSTGSQRVGHNCNFASSMHALPSLVAMRSPWKSVQPPYLVLPDAQH